jgi:hypothetical protein
VEEALMTIASKSAGLTQFLETPEDAEGIYSRILIDMNNRYIVGYYPTNKIRDGSRRKIEFSVKGHPDYHVIGRKSYYAPVN